MSCSKHTYARLDDGECLVRRHRVADRNDLSVPELQLTDPPLRKREAVSSRVGVVRGEWLLRWCLRELARRKGRNVRTH